MMLECWCYIVWGFTRYTLTDHLLSPQLDQEILVGDDKNILYCTNIKHLKLAQTPQFCQRQ